ncbi:MAG: SufS family cysteine desulfurase [Candidatus Peribacter sp.]|jgi:cysteine desulfurase / selenocysteine lyase|nr:SufS family cysteine desulfurase [Candidatus Peribacter sp.]MBT4393224.1 SufS family cysteine desulfurase [Candidatus Peribacter sp.]MBT4601119.1 SufS family cysteine desulfurase [Candidatus Peribacter sp.]MBT5148921.1 SufS family cysteine desulfurase [Candidatus Peribacter sp.]MBT5637200.1 SufS family cysteine desulfurase [Candidatus Peribacter sp.]
MLTIDEIRRQFPLIAAQGSIYLDSAATAQKPQIVLEEVEKFYSEENANVHRGMHALAEKATVAYEDARKTVAKFIGAAAHEIVFTHGCTESINLVAKSWGKANLKKGDTIALSILEHHSNIVPWQQLQEEIGITIKWIDIDDDGSLIIDNLDDVKLVAVTGCSNVLGTKPDLKLIIEKAHAAGAKVLVDAAQLVVHEKIDVTELDCDFLAFSGHKLYGPTGVGVLYAKRELLESMPPFMGGGMMIGSVTKEGFTAAEIPQKFEAGTPPIAQVIGLKAAINWLSQYDWNDIATHEQELISTATDALNTIEGLTILGTPESSCISFTIDDIHPHDLTEIVGRNGVSLRAGHHCAQPLHERLGVVATTRMSFGIYNTKEDIERATEEIQKAIAILRPA